jgi:hypothetical protein
MEESLLDKAFRLAPMSSAASIAYGLEHAPTFTISLLNGLLFASATEYHTRIEDENFCRSASRLSVNLWDSSYKKAIPERAPARRAREARIVGGWTDNHPRWRVLLRAEPTRAPTMGGTD